MQGGHSLLEESGPVSVLGQLSSPWRLSLLLQTQGLAEPASSMCECGSLGKAYTPRTVPFHKAGDLAAVRHSGHTEY